MEQKIPSSVLLSLALRNMILLLVTTWLATVSVEKQQLQRLASYSYHG